MSKVIKNNDGVAVVEGTPAARLIKDSDKFFNAKLPERKAGEKLVSRDISDIQRQENLDRDIKSFKLVSRDLSDKEPEETMSESPLTKKEEIEEKTPEEKEMKREEAVEKTKEFKRQRFAERSEEEQEATQGRFITTLGR
tara:strand:+ start:871 stop:1290 length:420 start_codon:yes stop_codon:yes gene_type:complete